MYRIFYIEYICRSCGCGACACTLHVICVYIHNVDYRSDNKQPQNVHLCHHPHFCDVVQHVCAEGCDEFLVCESDHNLMFVCMVLCPQS